MAARTSPRGERRCHSSAWCCTTASRTARSCAATGSSRSGSATTRCGSPSATSTKRTAALLGFLAAGTERIDLGVGVVNPYTRPPALLAMAAATLDRLSGGRLILGLGRSERELIEGVLGIPYGRPRERLREAVESVRALLAGETVEGVRLALTPSSDHVPIYVAAIGPRALRLAGAVADGVVLNAYAPAAYVRRAVAELRDAAREAGRDPDAVRIACMLVVRLTDRPDELLPQLRERLASLLAEPHTGEVLLEWGGFDPALAPRLRETIASAGPSDAARLVDDALVEAFRAARSTRSAAASGSRSTVPPGWRKRCCCRACRTSSGSHGRWRPRTV